jgi:hypothetical protein
VGAVAVAWAALSILTAPYAVAADGCMVADNGVRGVAVCSTDRGLEVFGFVSGDDRMEWKVRR